MEKQLKQIKQEKGFYNECLKDFKFSSIAAISYILIVCLLSWIFGYKVSAEDMTYIVGMPMWVVVGVILPWIIMVIITGIYALGYMKGEKL